MTNAADSILDTNPSPPLPREERRGRDVALRPLDAHRDVGRLHAISHGSTEKESVWDYLGYGPFEDVAVMRRFLEERQRSEDPLFFTVLDRTIDQPVGVVSFLAIDAGARRLELGHIWYAISHQRGRTNTETVYLMLCEAFERLRCRRVEWKCDARNRRSWNAAERLGFRHEGVFRQHLIVKGRNRDTAWFSMLDHEWPRARRALVRWLDWTDGTPPSLAGLRAEDDPDGA